MRTFVAIEVPVDIQAGIDAATQRLDAYLRSCSLARAVRWTPAASLHLTLRFLGDTNSSQKQAVIDGLSAIARTSRPLNLGVARYGCFPNRHLPRVIWRGLDGELTQLIKLQSDIEQAAQGAGYEAESRPYSPHLTVGRVRRGLSKTEHRKLGDCLSGFFEHADKPNGDSVPSRLQPPGFDTHSIVLMRSLLKAEGAQYSVLERFPLG